MIKALLDLQRSYGVRAAVCEGARRMLHRSAASFRRHREEVRDKRGFEIGGPTQRFRASGLFPVYPLAARVDNCNFSNETAWTGTLREGETFVYDSNRPPGYQYICDATDLHNIKSDTYDFILSSHSLEHIANPIKALIEWKRILLSDGLIVLIIPHKEGTFDQYRQVTALSHLIEDYSRGIDENSLAHLPELVALHDLSREPTRMTRELLRTRCLSNSVNRCMHHHVFTTASVIELLDYSGLQIASVECRLPHHIITVSRKLRPDQACHNEHWLRYDSDYHRTSPFRADRVCS